MRIEPQTFLTVNLPVKNPGWLLILLHKGSDPAMTQNTFPDANIPFRLFFGYREDMICNRKASEIDLFHTITTVHATSGEKRCKLRLHLRRR